MNETDTAIQMSDCLTPFVDAVRAVMKSQYLDRNGQIMGTQRTWGYVIAVHDDESDEETYGTIDVQEYQQDAPAGFHEGVLISAINQSKTGMTVVPCLYSDVLIAQDPLSKKEYVVMYSHVDLIQNKSHKEIMTGVVETEEFQEGDDGDDVHELKETGASAVTNYTKDNIIDKVQTKDGDCTVTQTFDGYVVEAKDSKVTIKSDGTIDVSGKNITVTADSVTVKSDDIKHNGGGQKMILGDKLVQHLKSLCSACASITVTTPHGPSGTPMNAGQFSSISGQLDNDLSSKSKLD